MHIVRDESADTGVDVIALLDEVTELPEVEDLDYSLRDVFPALQPLTSHADFFRH